MITPGDRINAKYDQRMAVDVVAGPDDASAPTRQRSFSAGPGAAPGSATQQMRSIVRILSVDPYKKTIAFRDPEGRYPEISVKSPELKYHLDKLKESDTVQATFTEALSVSLEPRRARAVGALRLSLASAAALGLRHPGKTNNRGQLTPRYPLR